MTDFNIPVMTVTFPPSTTNEVQSIEIELTDDNIHELEEALFMLATVNNMLSNANDATNSISIREGVTLIRIVDNESKIGLN